MQVVNWLPRTELPFAAPSRPELLLPPEPVVVAPFTPAPLAESPVEALVKPAERVKIEVPRPSLASTRTNAKVEEVAAPVAIRAPIVP
ncbi:MAG TPA: energy transducer TonB, partial [Pseudomonas sp.]|nr:energy transducer TonB [Pseudomonas sp.]